MVGHRRHGIGAPIVAGTGVRIPVVSARQFSRSTFALLVAFALTVSPLLAGVAWALPPLAEAAGPTTGTTGVTVSGFSGAGSTDPEFGSSTYSWSKSSGPGTVTFTTPNSETTSATFSVAGPYVVLLTVTDDEAMFDTDTVSITISDPPNTAPSVSAGTNQTITLPSSAPLNGTVTDDGLPDPPATVTTTWSKVSGPGTVTFGNASAIDTNASFSTDGTYVLRLTANDSALSNSATVQITVNPVPNTAPSVSAGTNQTITLPSSAPLNGTVTDDGLPDPPATVTTTWSKVSGPGTVTFGNASAIDTNASFSTDGTYVLRLTANDSALSNSATVQITVNPVPNTAPSVSAGTNQTITLPSSAPLNGTVTDDGLPDPPATVTTTWSKVSGPGTVTFGNASAIDTNASFSTDGTYVLRLTANDSALSNSATVQITVNPVPNTAPSVSAGTNQTITLPSSAPLNGTVTDDGLPDPPATVTTTWSKVSGPGTVTFGNASAIDTNASFSTDGTYVLRLTANDSALSNSATVQITVNPVPNTAPSVSAGTNQTITLPSSAPLNGTVTDDGLPDPPATVTTTWSKVSGPGTVTFGNASAIDTNASFSTDGTYVLRLTANDSALSNSATVQITVNDPFPTVSISAPAAGSTLSGTVTVSATASDNLGITQVQFYDGASLIGTDTNAPYSVSWNTTSAGSGNHTLTARATDTNNQTTTSSGVSVTVNLAPTVSITSPNAGSTLSGTVTLSATASDDNGITQVQFYDGASLIGTDTTVPYSVSWNTTSAGPGNHTLTARATDTNNQTTTSSGVLVTVNLAPVADAGGPYTGTAGVTVNVTGLASTDSDGSISTYAWSWGDGTTTPASSFAPAIHTYATGGTFTITLTVTDNDGTTDTDTATVIVTANAAPTVSVTNPTSGATVTGPVTVRIKATDAESAAGSLTVTFSIDGGATRTTSYNSFTTSYEATVDTTTLSDGSHSISARATDGFANTTASPSVTFIVDNNKAPTAGITSPTSNTRVSGQATITATATDDKAVRSVQFFVDGVSIGTDTSSIGGWSVVWNTTTATSGRHTLTATASDLPGKTGTSAAVFVTVDQPPTVDITRPSSLAVVKEQVTISATATDDNTVTRVEFFVDGVSIGRDTNASGGWSLSWNTRSVDNGRRTIRAIATDSNGQTTLDSVIVTVDNDLFPSVTITAPRDGATIYGVGIVVISVTASDDDGVDQVEFFVDGTSLLVDTDGTNGWSAAWNPTRAFIGSHTIRAVATDRGGQTTADSNTVTVQAFTTATTSPPTPTTSLPAVEINTPAEGLSATAFSLAPPTVSAGGEIALTVALAAEVPGKADITFQIDGQPLGDVATVNAGDPAAGTGASAVFTRTLPAGLQVGLHRIEVVTTDQPPQVLASRTVGVLGAQASTDEPEPAVPTGSPRSIGIILATIIGGAAALTAAGFAATGWYRRKMIVRRLATRGR